MAFLETQPSIKMELNESGPLGLEYSKVIYIFATAYKMARRWGQNIENKIPTI